LLEVTQKILERGVLDQVIIRSQISIDDMQFGYMPMDMVQPMQYYLQEKYVGKPKDLYFAFVDLEKPLASSQGEAICVNWALMSGL